MLFLLKARFRILLFGNRSYEVDMEGKSAKSLVKFSNSTILVYFIGPEKPFQTLKNLKKQMSSKICCLLPHLLCCFLIHWASSQKVEEGKQAKMLEISQN